MKELLMHVAVNAGRYIDVWNKSGQHVMNRRLVDQTVLDTIERLLKTEGELKAATFRKDNSLWLDRQDFTLRQETPVKTIPVAPILPESSPEKPMSTDQNPNVQLILLQNENQWLKKGHDRLERENSDLRVLNEKLRIENNDLSVKNATAEAEKTLALRTQQAEGKSGLGKIGSPDEIKELLTGVTEVFKAIKGESTESSAVSGTKHSGVKQEVVDFVGSKLSEISDEEAQKLAYIIKVVIDQKQIEHLFTHWTGEDKQTA